MQVDDRGGDGGWQILGRREDLRLYINEGAGYEEEDRGLMEKYKSW